MSHVFISYSRHDQPYARALADHLIASGFDVWIDDRIDYGSRWVDVIQQAVEDCAAFVVVMSPHSRESQYAAQRGKAAFPLLLDGEVFFRYVSVQAVDVRDGALPPDAFLDELAEHARRHPDRGQNVAPPEGQAESEPPGEREAAAGPVRSNRQAWGRLTVLVGAALMLALVAAVVAIRGRGATSGDSDSEETRTPTTEPIPVQTAASVVGLETGAPSVSNCANEWFFGDEYAVTGDCPVSGPTELTGMIQNFGGGVLIGLLLSTYGDGRYLVFENGGSYQDIAYNWTEEVELVGSCVLPSIADVLDELPYDVSVDEIIGCPLQPVEFRSLEYQTSNSITDFIVYVGYIDSDSLEAAVYRLEAPSSRPETPGVWQRIR